jgi:hypothetical protein
VTTKPASESLPPLEPTFSFDEPDEHGYRFAKVLMDTPVYPLLSREADLPCEPIGFLRRGVTVFASATRGEYVEIDAPFPSPWRTFLTNTDLGWMKSRAVHKFAVLAPMRARPQHWSKLSEAGVDEWGYYRTLHFRTGISSRALIQCGRLRRLSTRGRFARVAVEYPAGELWGWMPEATPSSPPEAKEYGDWDIPCMLPDRPDPPQDYETASTRYFVEHPLEHLIKAGDTFHRAEWIEWTQQFVCHEVRVVKDPLRSLMLQFVADDGAVDIARTLSLKGNSLSTGVEGFSTQGKAIMTSTGEQWRAVKEDKGSIGFIAYGRSPEEAKTEVAYFPPEALEWWDREAARCQERATLLNSIP